MSVESVRKRLAAAKAASAARAAGLLRETDMDEWYAPSAVLQAAEQAVKTDLPLALDVVEAAKTVNERLACNHVFDPECARCEWLTPFRRAVDAFEAAP